MYVYTFICFQDILVGALNIALNLHSTLLLFCRKKKSMVHAVMHPALWHRVWVAGVLGTWHKVAAETPWRLYGVQPEVSLQGRPCSEGGSGC